MSNAAFAVVERRWQSARGEPYNNGGGRLQPVFVDGDGMDCSGSVHWANEPVLYLPLNSSAVAEWSVKNGLVKPAGRAAPGDILLWGRDGDPRHGSGNDGHIGQKATDPGMEWESTGPGVNLYRYGSRVPWQWAVDMSPWYGTAVVTPTDNPPIDWAGIARLAQLLNNRKRFPMWLLRDSRDGGVFLYNGIHARHLDGVELDQNKAFMARLGLPTDIIDATNYQLDRLRERGLIVGTGF